MVKVFNRFFWRIKVLEANVRNTITRNTLLLFVTWSSSRPTHHDDTSGLSWYAKKMQNWYQVPIRMTGPASLHGYRRFRPTKMWIAQAQIEYIMNLCIDHPYDSEGASPLHLPKKIKTWWLVAMWRLPCSEFCYHFNRYPCHTYLNVSRLFMG